MELIALRARTALLVDRASGQLAVAHSDCGLTRGLELDEQVLLLDPEGDYHSATVVDLEFTLDDTTYVLELGVRLPPATARARLAGDPDPEPGAAVVLDLLALLRDDARRR